MLVSVALGIGLGHYHASHMDQTQWSQACVRNSYDLCPPYLQELAIGIAKHTVNEVYSHLHGAWVYTLGAIWILVVKG